MSIPGQWSRYGTPDCEECDLPIDRDLWTGLRDLCPECYEKEIEKCP